MDEWILPRAPQNEGVQASAPGLSSSIAYALTTALSYHCLACWGGRASDHSDIYRCKSETTPGPNPAWQGLRHRLVPGDVC